MVLWQEFFENWIFHCNIVLHLTATPCIIKNIKWWSYTYMFHTKSPFTINPTEPNLTNIYLYNSLIAYHCGNQYKITIKLDLNATYVNSYLWYKAEWENNSFSNSLPQLWAIKTSPLAKKSCMWTQFIGADQGKWSDSLDCVGNVLLPLSLCVVLLIQITGILWSIKSFMSNFGSDYIPNKSRRVVESSLQPRTHFRCFKKSLVFSNCIGIQPILCFIHINTSSRKKNKQYSHYS